MTTLSPICKTCRRPKATYNCGLCQDHLCKACAQFMDEEAFSFSRNVPQELKHPIYCTNCFDENVSKPLDEYNQKMEEAKEVYIFTKEQTKQTRLLKRAEPPYEVENCADEEEAILKMSFWAVEDKFNALIDLQLSSKKIIVGSHKKSIWSGKAVPININPKEVSGY